MILSLDVFSRTSYFVLPFPITNPCLTMRQCTGTMDTSCQRSRSLLASKHPAGKHIDQPPAVIPHMNNKPSCMTIESTLESNFWLLFKPTSQSRLMLCYNASRMHLKRKHLSKFPFNVELGGVNITQATQLKEHS